MGIYKAYDIRGVYPGELDEKLAYKIGQAVATFLNVSTLLVSRDMRLSGPQLTQAVIEGITDQGCDVVDAGLLSTPGNTFAIAHYGYPGGVQVTASHNPPQYNGFKISRKEAIPLSGDSGIPDIQHIVEAGRFPKASRKGKVTKRDAGADYTAHVLGFLGKVKPMKIVVDVANGMGATMLPPILERIPGDFVRLFFDLDGSFPNHDSNVLIPANLEPLRQAVLREKADVGFALDGDCDRCAFVDNLGNIVPCDLAGALIAREVLSHEPGATIICDPRSSRAVHEEIRAAGGKSEVERVGHAFMKTRLRNTRAPFGLELSGHYYYRDNFCCDSGDITMVKMINLLGTQSKSLAELVRPLLRYATTGEVNFEVEDKDGKIAEIGRVFSDGRISHIDGITVEYDDWWFNVRKSNTEPLLRLTLEGNTPQLRDKGFARLKKLLGNPVAHWASVIGGSGLREDCSPGL